MLLNCYVCSKKGKFRENNEDNFYLNGEYLAPDHSDKSFACKCNTNDNIFAGVFDGLGGEEKGEEASYKAAYVLDNWDRNIGLEEYFKIANDEVCNIKKGNSSKRAGSTAAIVSFFEKSFIAANIGDSRIYQIRDNVINMLSVDHTMTETMVASGILTRDEAEKSMYKNCLLQCLGMDKKEMAISPYISGEMELRKDDVFIICSDGLSGTLNKEEIFELINVNVNSVNIAEILVDAAYDKGARDNTTVIVIYVKDSGIKNVFYKLKRGFKS